MSGFEPPLLTEPPVHSSVRAAADKFTVCQRKVPGTSPKRSLLKNATRAVSRDHYQHDTRDRQCSDNKTSHPLILPAQPPILTSYCCLALRCPLLYKPARSVKIRACCSSPSIRRRRGAPGNQNSTGNIFPQASSLGIPPPC